MTWPVDPMVVGLLPRLLHGEGGPGQMLCGVGFHACGSGTLSDPSWGCWLRPDGHKGKCLCIDTYPSEGEPLAFGMEVPSTVDLPKKWPASCPSQRIVPQ